MDINYFWGDLDDPQVQIWNPCAVFHDRGIRRIEGIKGLCLQDKKIYFMEDPDMSICEEISSYAERPLTRIWVAGSDVESRTAANAILI